MRVLIAEDEKKTRALLVEMVQSLGCETLEAGTGYEAVKVVQESKPDVLLLDGLLPEMHGFEVARFVRSMAPLPPGYFPTDRCKPVLVKSSGPWSVFENVNCRTAP